MSLIGAPWELASLYVCSTRNTDQQSQQASQHMEQSSQLPILTQHTHTHNVLSHAQWNACRMPCTVFNVHLMYKGLVGKHSWPMARWVSSWPSTLAYPSTSRTMPWWHWHNYGMRIWVGCSSLTLFVHSMYTNYNSYSKIISNNTCVWPTVMICTSSPPSFSGVWGESCRGIRNWSMMEQRLKIQNVKDALRLNAACMRIMDMCMTKVHCALWVHCQDTLNVHWRRYTFGALAVYIETTLNAGRHCTLHVMARSSGPVVTPSKTTTGTHLLTWTYHYTDMHPQAHMQIHMWVKTYTKHETVHCNANMTTCKAAPKAPRHIHKHSTHTHTPAFTHPFTRFQCFFYRHISISTHTHSID